MKNTLKYPITSDSPILESHQNAVAKYFQEHPGAHLTAADLSDALNIKFWICTQVCEDLAAAGKIT